jgi:hypothetical protein
MKVESYACSYIGAWVARITSLKGSLFLSTFNFQLFAPCGMKRPPH